MWQAGRELRHRGFNGKLVEGAVWTSCLPYDSGPLESAGWKIHISCRAHLIVELAAQVLPVLLGSNTAFKIASSDSSVRDLNDGVVHPTSVGKIVTVYPREDEFKSLIEQLVAATVGIEGPRVLSDRRADAAAPVYYRYGPAAGTWRLTEQGNHQLMMALPNGELVDGAAGLRYERPPGTRDPLDRAEVEPLGVLDGRYIPSVGIRQSARGDVYEAWDNQAQRSVIVKQARAWVAEVAGEIDCRMRLRNEYRTLLKLKSISAVPNPLDYLRAGDDEYLVLERMSGETLRKAVWSARRIRFGIEVWDEPDPYIFDGWRASGLINRSWRLLDKLHQCGVQWRDVSPSNILLDRETQGVSFVDFGVAGSDGLYFTGGTLGYLPPAAVDTVLPDDFGVDTFGLCRALLYLISGIEPTVTTNSEHSVRGYLEQLRDSGCNPKLVSCAVHGDSLHRDAWSSFSRATHNVSYSVPNPGKGQAELGSRITDDFRRLEAVSSKLSELARWWCDPRPGQYSDRDASIYSGAGGALWVSLYADRVGVETAAATTEELSRRINQVVMEQPQGPGLLMGVGGLRVLNSKLRTAGFDGLDETRLDALFKEQFSSDRIVPSDLDLMYGRAGGALAEAHCALLEGRSLSEAAVSFLEVCADESLQMDLAINDLEDEFNGVPRGCGIAHGRSGLVSALSFAVLAGADRLISRLESQAEYLCALVENADVTARAAQASPVSSSWCQGTAGLAHTLAAAAIALENQQMAELALRLAYATVDWIPYRDTTSVCCGVVGMAATSAEIFEVFGDSDGYRATEQRAAAVLRQRRYSPSVPGSFVPPHAAPTSWGLGALGEVQWEVAQVATDPLASSASFWPVPSLVGVAGAIGTSFGVDCDRSGGARTWR